MKIIWITWEKQRRNREISSSIGAELFELHSKRSRMLRYVELTITTLYIFYSQKPDIVIAQNPSIILTVLVILLKSIFKYKVVIDAHNSGIFPYDGKYLILNLLSKYSQRSADLTIVTNKHLLAHVVMNRGKCIVLPDKIPTPNPMHSSLSEKNRIVFICSFSRDEPYYNVIMAGSFLPKEYSIYITGKFSGKIHSNTQIPENVKLVGFLSENDYWNLLYNADVIMDLTTRENCLVCGAYEGISIEKPLILSNTKINREFFHSGCTYVDSNVESICRGILESFRNIKSNQKNIRILKRQLEDEWFARNKVFCYELKRLIN